MAGTDARFNSDAFRSAIAFAMAMGSQETNNEVGVEFRWVTRPSFTQQDAGGNPFTWDSAAASPGETTSVTVLAAVEEVGRDTSSDTSIGLFNTPSVIITLLDDQYERIFDEAGRRADIAIFQEAEYEVQYVAPAMALFDVNVYQVHCRARDEA